MNTGLHNFLYSLPMYFIHIFIGLCFMYLFGTRVTLSGKPLPRASVQ